MLAPVFGKMSTHMCSFPCVGGRGQMFRRRGQMNGTRD